jgi:hypothetical protein
MRAREFIMERNKHPHDDHDPFGGNVPKTGKVHDDHTATMNPSLVLTDMDPGYDYYRFMMTVAASPNDVPVETHLKAVPFSMPYTKQDEDMLHHALKRMGKNHSHITSDWASEPKSTNNTSPVPQNSGARRKKK